MSRASKHPLDSTDGEPSDRILPPPFPALASFEITEEELIPFSAFCCACYKSLQERCEEGQLELERLDAEQIQANAINKEMKHRRLQKSAFHKLLESLVQLNIDRADQN